MEVLGLYFEGLSYDEISRKAKVSKGSVVNVVRELREGKHPEFEDLSEIVDEHAGSGKQGNSGSESDPRNPKSNNFMSILRRTNSLQASNDFRAF